MTIKLVRGQTINGSWTDHDTLIVGLNPAQEMALVQGGDAVSIPGAGLPAGLTLTAAQVGALTFGSTSLKRLPIPEPVAAASLATTNTGLDAATITGSNSVMVAWNSGKFTYPNGNIIVAGNSYPDNICGRYQHVTSPLVQQNFSAEIEFTGTRFECQVKNCSASNAKLRFLLDDKIVNTGSSIVVAGVSGDVKYVLCDFGSLVSGRLRIEGNYSFFAGLKVDKSASIQPVDYSAHPLVISFGDSYEEGTGSTWMFEGHSWRLARALGLRRFWSSGLGSTGYMANGSGTKLDYVARYPLDVVPYAPSAVFVTGSINDESQTLSAVTAKIQSLFALHKSSLPNVPLLVTGVPLSRSANDVANNAAIKAAALAAGLPFADPIAATGGQWITGTGRVGATTSDGNRDWAIGADDAHPTDAGHKLLAALRKQGFAATSLA